MKNVRQVSRLRLNTVDAIADLRNVVADIVDAINSKQDIHFVALTGLDGAGEIGGAAESAHTHVFHEEFTGSGVGPYVLDSTPDSESETIFVDGSRQRRKSSSPGLNEYYMSAPDAFTFGWSVFGYICVDYKVATPSTHVHVVGIEVSGTGTTLYLPETPQVGSEVLNMNGIRLRRLSSGSPGLNEYTISGNEITLASPGKQAGDILMADYIA